MRGYLLLMVIVSTIPFVLAKPHVGILVYSWFGYMNPHRLVYGIVNNLPFAFILGALTTVAWLFSRESKKPPITGISALVLIYTIWVSITTLFAIVPDAAFAKWDKVINKRERINQLVWVMVISLGSWGVVGGVFTILSGGNYRVWGPRDSLIADNNALGLALIMTLPLMRYLQIQTTQLWLKFALLGAILLTGFSILGSQSRGAFVAGAAMVLVLWLRSRRRLPLAIALIAVIAAGLGFMPAKYFERIDTLNSYEEDGSANARLTTWGFAFEFALTEPLFGGGFSMFEDAATRERFLPGSKLHNAHSIWFETLGEHGFVGFFLFVAIGVTTLLTCGRIRKRCRDSPEMDWAFDLASMLQVSIVGFAVGGTFLNQASFDFYWQLVALTVCLSVFVRHELALLELKPIPSVPLPHQDNPKVAEEINLPIPPRYGTPHPTK
jgi:putative inorganic carbon (hco3(-)) transporter